MKGVAKASGFTIVETMIVLAVTGLLFLSAATLISGKEAKVQFTTAIQNIQQQVQQTVNDVQSGYYPNNKVFSCTPQNNIPPTITAFNPTKSQGANAGCIFVGKVLQFGIASSNPNNPEQYNTYTLAANQKYQNVEVTSLNNAYPVVIAPGHTLHSGWPDASAARALQYGLTTAWMRYVTNGPHSIGAVAFVARLASIQSGNLISGSEQFDVLPITNTQLNVSPGDAVDAIDQNVSTNATISNIDPAGGVEICFNSGTTKQSGLVTVGGPSGTNNVTLQTFSSPGCV